MPSLRLLKKDQFSRNANSTHRVFVCGCIEFHGTLRSPSYTAGLRAAFRWAPLGAKLVDKVCADCLSSPRLVLLFFFRCDWCFRHPRRKAFFACGVISICSGAGTGAYCTIPVLNADSAVFHTMESNACLGLLTA